MVNVAQSHPDSLSWERLEQYPGEGETAAIWRWGAPYYRDRGQQRSGLLGDPSRNQTKVLR